MMAGRWLRIALIAFAAISMPLSGGVSAQDASLVAVAETPELGAYLTDAEGRTLYLFTPDTTAGESTCYDKCAEAWPPLAPAEGMRLPAGVPGALETIERSDGTQQVAYNGIPLYSYAADDEAGDVYGQGVGGVWFKNGWSAAN